MKYVYISVGLSTPMAINHMDLNRERNKDNLK